jgi:CBS domain-containing protein
MRTKMLATAQDVMTTRFHTLQPEMTLAEASRLFKSVSEDEKRRVFGLVVTDSNEQLIGMLSMYDILWFICPKHIHIWGVMEDIDITGLLDSHFERARLVQVGDIMTTDVIAVTPETNLVVVLDIMLKKHIRRIPVVKEEKMAGIVYISDLFYYILDRLRG